MYVLPLNGVMVTIIIVINIPRILGGAALRHVGIQKILLKVFVLLLKAMERANIQMEHNAVRFILFQCIYLSAILY